MYYGSSRATAMALSTMLLALLLASSFTSTPMVHGQSATVSPTTYPIFCDSTGNLAFTFNAGVATWKGVAIELPRDFLGLADGDTSKVDAREFTYDPRLIAVYDERLHYPYSPEQDYYWVQIGAHWLETVGDPAWTGFSGSKTLTLVGIKAPSVAGDYTIKLYYTTTNFPCTYNLPTDFSTGKGTALPDVTVKVHMREEASTISGTVSDTSVSPALTLSDGYVTATAVGGPLNGKVVAKTKIASDGSYSLTGLYAGTYTLTAWGKKTTVAGYPPFELTPPITVERRATLTGINIAINRGGEISGNVRLRLQDGTPVTPNTAFSGAFTLPGAELPVRLELVDSGGRVVKDLTVNVPAAANSVSYSIKELYDYTGIPAGSYTLRAYAFGFIQTTPVSVSISALGGATIDVPLVKGGGISGTLFYLTAQGTAYTLTADTTVLVEAVDSAGALKGAWIGTALAGQTNTPFYIQGTGESITPATGAGFTPEQLKTYSGRGVKDGGLADGGYTLKASVGGFVQPTPYPTAVVSAAGTGYISVNLKKGGTITGTIYAKDTTGVYAENWQRATPPTWEYDSGITQTRIEAYVYNSAGSVVGLDTTSQNSGAQTSTFTCTGIYRTTESLQAGYKQTALADGTYTVRVYTWGYWQPNPDSIPPMSYPTATIYSGGTQAVDCPMRRGGAVDGTITFREAGATIPGGITGEAMVEAIDATGKTQGAAFYTLSAQQQLAYSIYGKYKHGLERDGGIVDGGYTIKLTLYAFTHPTQTVNVALGGPATLNFNAHRMGTVTGTVRGAVTFQATPVPLSWVRITLSSSPVAYTTYSADGSYSIPVPDGSYTMTFATFGYQPHTLTLFISSGATQVISPDLVETFEPIPEFPLGTVFTLAASLALAFYLLRWTRKPINIMKEI